MLAIRTSDDEQDDLAAEKYPSTLPTQRLRDNAGTPFHDVKITEALDPTTNRCYRV